MIKRGFYFVTFLLVLLFISVVSAGWFDWISNIFGGRITGMDIIGSGDYGSGSGGTGSGGSGCYGSGSGCVPECGSYSFFYPIDVNASSRFGNETTVLWENLSIDKKIQTYWLNNISYNNSHWIYYDFGEKVCIRGFNISFEGNVNDFYMNFSLQVSDDARIWTSIGKWLTNGPKDRFLTYYFPETKARYIRLNKTDGRSQNISIREFLIYGADYLKEGRCFDSDGLDYFNKGNISGRFIGGGSFFRSDYCSNNNLVEWRCSGNNINSTLHFCENGCLNGACKEGTNGFCNDGDGGKNYNIAGITTNASKQEKDYCSLDEKNVYEFYCSGNNIYVENYICDDKCVDGRCLAACSDSDNGLNIYEKGTSKGYNLATNKDEIKEDTCLNTNELVEWYCTPNYLTSIIQNCENGCLNGICSRKENSEKRMELYTPKQAFLVSDKNWKDVLPLVSMTTWTGDEEVCQKGYETAEGVCVYPTLIYHEEDNGAFDADSIIYFMQQYKPDRVILVGDVPLELRNLLVAESPLGGEIDINKITRMDANETIDFWNNYKEIVYTEDKYEISLIASTYASLINSPLIIKGSDNDNEEVLSGKRIICVGDVSPGGLWCDEKYTKEQMQKKYAEITKTNKVILVNPNDLDINVKEEFQPEKSGLAIGELYGKTSLSAPFLASAKEEVMTFSTAAGYKEIDNEFTSQFLNIFGYKANDFNPIECKLGDSCSSEPDYYDLPVKRSISDWVEYNFNLETLDNKLIKGININNLMVSEECANNLKKEDVEMYIDGKKYSLDYLSFWYNDYYDPQRFPLKQIFFGYNLKSDDGLVLGKSVNIKIRIPNCEIIRLHNEIRKVLILGLSLEGTDYEKRIYFDNEEGMKDSSFKLMGLAAGATASFDFSGLNPSLNYKIYIESENNGAIEEIYVNDINSELVLGEQIVNGKIRIKIKINEDIGGRNLFIFRRVVLYPQLNRDNYLTVFASPAGIQMNDAPFSSGDYEFSLQTDVYPQTLYAEYDPIANHRQNFDKYLYQFYLGRIFGISSTDSSSYVARDLFFDKIPKNSSAAFVFMGTTSDTPIEILKSDYSFESFWKSEENIYKEFKDEIYRCYTYNDAEWGCYTKEAQTKNSFYNSYFTLYDDHGWYDWAFISSSDLKNKYLQPKTSFISACDTCDITRAKNEGRSSQVLCSQHIRRGSLAYIGAQSISWQSSDTATRDFVPLLIINKEPIGKAWQKNNAENDYGWSPYYVLIGDPTFTTKNWGEAGQWQRE